MNTIERQITKNNLKLIKHIKHSRKLELKAGLYGANSHQYQEVKGEHTNAGNRSKNSTANAGRIKRVLNKDHEYKKTGVFPK